MFHFTSNLFLPRIRPTSSALQYLLSWELRILHHYYYYYAVSSCSLQRHLHQAFLAFVGRIYVAKSCWGGWERSRKCHLQWACDSWGLLYKLHYHFNHTVHLLFPWDCALSSHQEKPAGNLSSKKTQHPCAGSATIMQIEELKTFHNLSLFALLAAWMFVKEIISS